MNNQKIINDICLFLKNEKNMNDGYFCIYGSYATCSQNENSDIDILYVSNSIKTPKRISSLYKKIKITVYKLSEDHLLQDAKGKYGGFFCGKMFNPHIIFPYSRRNNIFIDNCVTTFFSRLLDESSFKLDNEYDEDEVLKKLINVYMELYPEYFAYIMRLVNINNFNSIWETWRKRTIFSLLMNNILAKKDDKFYFKKNIPVAKFNKLKISYVSRFWIFGAISHSSNLDFYDFYVNKNVDYITKNKILWKKCEDFLDRFYTLVKED